MDWNDTPEQAAFRQEVRTLIQEKRPERYRNGGNWMADRRSSDPEARAAADAWTAALSERGWFAPHWPKQYGGGGLSTIEQMIFREEMAKAHAPTVGGVGVAQYGLTIMIHGTEAQKEEFIPQILSGDLVMTSGLSEPGAGSDLASLQTKAVRDGDDYVVDGQKIWSSNAHFADYLWVPVRTDSDAPKHRGISCLLIPTDLPGVSIRPLANMAGEHGFNETFFESVRVPVKNRIGEENRGWYVGATALDFERSNLAGAAMSVGFVPGIAEYVETPEGQQQHCLGRLPALRTQLAELHIEANVHYNLCLRIASMQARGLVPNMEASIGKLFGAELSQRQSRTAVAVFGLYGQLWDKRAPMNVPAHAYVRSVSSTIAGGTSEIQRNIIAGRGLGLPRG